MSRVVWIGVGAIGGALAYRRGQRAVNAARERGLVGNVQQAALTASQVANGAGKLLSFAGQVGQGSSGAANFALEQDAASWRELQNSRVAISAQTGPTKANTRTSKNGRRSTAVRLAAIDSPKLVDIRSNRNVRVS